MKEGLTIKVLNRYQTELKFTKVGNEVVVSGFGKYYRIGSKNDYSKAYDKFCKSDLFDGKSEKEFEDALHRSELLSDNFSKYLEEAPGISYVDPEGGPFLSVGMDLGILSSSMKGLEVKEILIGNEVFRLILK